MSSYQSDVLDGFGISIADINQIRNEHIGFCNVELSRVSEFLLIQLASIRKHHIYNIFSITDVIQELEGVGRGVKQKTNQFKHEPLKGFWKAHFFDARFIVRNLMNETGVEFKNSPKFSAICKKAVLDEEKSPTKHGWIGRLSHEMTIGAFEKRARRNALTGEWIIFSQYEGRNYYLCISRHFSGKDKDQEMYDFLNTLLQHEYPFLLQNSI